MNEPEFSRPVKKRRAAEETEAENGQPVQKGAAAPNTEKPKKDLTFAGVMREFLSWSPTYAFMLLMLLGREIYIEQLQVSVSAMLLYLFGGVILLTLQRSRPLSEDCRAFPFGLVRLLLPILLVGLIFFAEIHFTLTVVLLLLPLPTAVAVFFLRRFYWKKHHKKKSAGKRARVEAHRTLVLLLGLLILVPSFIGFYRVRIGGREPVDPDPIAANAASLSVLSRFDTLDRNEKIDLAQAIADTEAVHLGILPVHIQTDPLSGGISGEYRYEGRFLCLDRVVLEEAGAARFVLTVCHEIRHAFQDDTVRLLNRLPAQSAKSVYFDNARAWRDNLHHYLTVDLGAEQYLNQPIELDARNYAEARLPAYRAAFFPDSAPETDIITDIITEGTAE